MPMHRMVIPGMTDGNDTLMGGAGDDLLLGGPGDDHLDGMGGSDVFDGGPGGDAIIGGDGMDYVSYIRSPAGVYVDIGSNFNIDDDDKPPVHGGYAEGDTLTEVEGIFGSVFGDTFRGDHQANRLFGYKGNDVIYGRDGNDYIRGESGGDNLFGDSGNDQLFGDTGNDKLDGGGGHDRLWGGKGNDVLYGGPGSDTMEGGAGADVHDGGFAGAVLTSAGLLGGDTAAYSLSPEAVTVNLKYAYDLDPTTVPAMGGHAEGDTFARASAAASDGTTTTTESVNHVSGSMHNDMLTGSDMNNRLSGGEGDDTLSGGKGHDALMGQMGDDQLMGGDGNDTLAGGEGADMLDGGDNTDTADYSTSSEAVRVDLSEVNQDTGLPAPSFEGGDAEGDSNPKGNLENLIGSDHADLLIGNRKANKLEGGDGNDWDIRTTSAKEGGLFGMEGNDTLAGGDGADYLSGGMGSDDLWGQGGDDLIEGGEGDDAPHYIVTFDGNDPVTPNDATDDTMAGTIASQSAWWQMDLTDSAVLASLMENNIRRGGLFGGDGSDTLVGGDGADFIDGGSGSDTVSYKGPSGDATSGVSITLGIGAMLGTGGDNEDTDDDDDSVAMGDLLTGIENVIGSDGDDSITGNILANRLNGGDGDDSLTGGGGADTFVFEEGEGSDTIADFSRFDRDRIDLSDFDWTTSTLNASLTEDATGNAVIVDGWVDTNTNGSYSADDDEGTLVVTLTGVSAGDLSIDDFIL